MVNYNYEDKEFEFNGGGFTFEDVDFEGDVKEVHVYHHIVPPTSHCHQCKGCDFECDDCCDFECDDCCGCELMSCRLDENAYKSGFISGLGKHYDDNLEVNDDELDEYLRRSEKHSKGNVEKLGVVLGAALLGSYVATQVKKGNIDKDILHKIKDVVPEKPKNLLKDSGTFANKVKDKAINKVSDNIDMDKLEELLVKGVDSVLLKFLNTDKSGLSKTEKEDLLDNFKANICKKVEGVVSEVVEKTKKNKDKITEVGENLKNSDNLEDKKEAVKGVVEGVKAYAENKKNKPTKEEVDDTTEEVNDTTEEVDEAQLEELAKVLEDNNADLSK